MSETPQTPNPDSSLQWKSLFSLIKNAQAGTSRPEAITTYAASMETKGIPRSLIRDILVGRGIPIEEAHPISHQAIESWMLPPLQMVDFNTLSGHYNSLEPQARKALLPQRLPVGALLGAPHLLNQGHPVSNEQKQAYVTIYNAIGPYRVSAKKTNP